MQKISVLLADDHTILRQGVAEILDAQKDIEVVAQASNGEEAVALCQKLRPRIALLDISMPKLDGVEATRQITDNFPEIGIIILTMYRRDDYVFEAIKAGASGYLLKEIEMSELLSAVRRVAAGEAVIDPAIAARVFDELRGKKRDPKVDSKSAFSERDLEIFQHLAQGLTNQEIADLLHISEKTVRNRLSLVFRQFHLKNRTEAALFAIREGLVEKDEKGQAKD